MSGYRVAHLANFYSPTSGGLKTTINQLAYGYSELGIDFWVIVPGERYGLCKKDSHTVVYLPGIPLANSGYRVMPSASNAIAVLRKLRPGVIEVSDRLTLVKVGRWAKVNRIPSIVFSHESVTGLANRYLGDVAQMPLFGGALGFALRSGVSTVNRRLGTAFDSVVCTTDYAAKDFVGTGSHVVKIALGVDLAMFSPGKFDSSVAARLRAGHKFSMVVCTRLHPEKRPERAIAILQSLFSQGVDARLTFVGEGPMRGRLRKLSRGLPVDFIGYVKSREEVATLLASADFVVAPGPIETFGLAALEALACGTPVIASGEGALAEVIGEAGAVSDGSVASFVSGIQKVLAVSEPLRRRRARVRAEMFPWANAIGGLVSLHQQIATRKQLTLPRVGAVSEAA